MSMRVALKRALKWVGVLLLLMLAFLWGFMTREEYLPPYGWVMPLYAQASHSPTLRAWARPLENLLRGPARQEEGLWREIPIEGAEGPLTSEQEEELADLMALGYATGVRTAEGQSAGVTLHDPELAFDGLNLIVSGHATEATLMDMRGNGLHRWSLGFDRAFPEITRAQSFKGTQYWRRAHLFDNGDLLAIFDNNGLIKIDRRSRLLWAYPERVHHDLEVTPDGTIYTLTGEIKFLPRITEVHPVIEEFIVALDADGRPLHEVSLLEAFETSSYASFLDKMPIKGDIFHTNTLEIFDGSHEHRSPIFKRGNALISMRSFDVIAIVDLDLGEVVWALAGRWLRQHQPTMLASGNMLLFDNAGDGNRSRILEFDPLSQELVWTYEGNAENPFFSRMMGSSQRLPNGNTLVSETDNGRAFETTPDGTIVWEYRNPRRVGESSTLIATLPEVIRLGPERPDWLAE